MNLLPFVASILGWCALDADPEAFNASPAASSLWAADIFFGADALGR